tara:strand:- start:1807 stop:1944 length:138 start_codon:yes stop_codon:yes gene_type:complete
MIAGLDIHLASNVDIERTLEHFRSVTDKLIARSLVLDDQNSGDES